MSHHEQGPNCPLCAEKLATAHEKLQEWFDTFVKPAFPECHVSWAYRDQTNQEECFKAGKSKLHFPMSPHNKSDDQGNPCSLALDLFLIDSTSGDARFPIRWYHSLYELCQKRAQPIEWGGNFKSIHDFDHYQLVNP